MNGIWILAVATALLSQTATTGTIKGHLDIGPLSPVQRVGVKETPSPEMYKRYELRIKAAPAEAKFSSRMYKRVVLNKHGDFSAQLAPGRYRVEIAVAEGNQPGFMRPPPVQYISVVAGKTVKVKLNIDTGIR